MADEIQGTLYINLPRGAGKTNYLIIRSSITGYTMVVRDNDNKQRVLERAKEIKTLIPEPITFKEYKDRYFEGRNIKGFLFDDYKDYKNQYKQTLYVVGPPIVEVMM